MLKQSVLVFLGVVLAIIIIADCAKYVKKERRTTIIIKRGRRGNKRSVDQDRLPTYIPCDFKSMDINRNGFVSKEELGQVLQNREASPSGNAAVQLVFDTIDLDGDALLVEEEFDIDYKERRTCILDDLVERTVMQTVMV